MAETKKQGSRLNRSRDKEPRTNQVKYFKQGDNRYTITLITYNNAAGDKLINTLYCDFDIKNLSIKDVFGTGEEQGKLIDAYFSEVKKQFEIDNPDCMIVFNYPSSFIVNKKPNKTSHIMCYLTMYIPPEVFDKKASCEKYKDELINICIYIDKLIKDKFNQ